MNDLADQECSAADLAALFGLSERHITRLVGRVKIGRGRWRLGDAVPVLIEALGAGNDGEALTTQRVRLVRAQADRAEMEYALAKGEIAPITEMQRVWERRCALIQARMMQVSQRAVTQIVAERDESKIKAVLTDEIRQALIAAAGDPDEIFDEEDDENADHELES